MTEKTNFLTLQECVDRLCQDMKSGAPALITLKRWSASGLLNSAKTVPDGATRAKYRYDQVLITARRYTRIKLSESSAAFDPYALNLSHAPHPLDCAAPYPEVAHDTREKESTDAQQGEVRDMHIIDPEALSKAVAAELAPMIEQSMQAIQKQMLDGLSNLDATRKSLMLKYDAELYGLREKVVSLMAENKKLSLDAVDSYKMNLKLSKIQETIDARNR